MRTEYTFDELLAEHDVEIVHDIDLKDGKFGRPEAAGIDRLIAGIAMGNRDDESRLERGLPCSTTSTRTSAEGEAES